MGLPATGLFSVDTISSRQSFGQKTGYYDTSSSLIVLETDFCITEDVQCRGI